MTDSNTKILEPVGYLNKMTGHIWTPAEEPDAAEQPGYYEPLVRLSDVAALLIENAQVREIIDSVTNLDNEPEYHAEGMGCGLEDNGITDRYAAMRHGWDQAMERIYGDVIPCAEELAFESTDYAVARMQTEWKARGVDEFAAHMQSEKPFWEPEDWESMDFASELSTQFAANLRAGRNG